MQVTLSTALLVTVALTVAEAGTGTGGHAWAELAARPRGDASAPLARLDLGLGLGLRNDTLSTRAAEVTAEGHTGSNLALGAAWFGSHRSIGLAAAGAVERLTLRGQAGAYAPESVEATGGFALAALAVRAEAAQGRIGLEAQAGYGLVQLPVVFIAAQPGPTGLRSGSVRGHGPTLALGVTWSADPRFAIEVRGDAMPLGFSGEYQDVAVSPRRFALAAGVSLGRLDVAGTRWSALVNYDLARTTAPGDGVEIRQLRQHVGIGLRARWLDRPAPMPAASPAQTAPPPLPGRLRIIVREKTAAGGETTTLLPGIQISSDAGTFTTDSAGQLLLTGIAPGPIELRAQGAGFQPLREVVAFPAHGDATAELYLARAVAAAPAPPHSTAITGLVRADDGTPVTARVRLVELGLEQEADGQGGFHFDVAPGHYTLTIEADGYVSQRKQILAGSDEQQIYNVDLQAERR